MDRSEILNAAEQAITVDRAATHGDAARNLEALAMMRAALDHARGDRPKAPCDEGIYMIGFKAVRASANPLHADNFVDAAGWSAVAGEIAGSAS